LHFKANSDEVAKSLRYVILVAAAKNVEKFLKTGTLLTVAELFSSIIRLPCLKLKIFISTQQLKTLSKKKKRKRTNLQIPEPSNLPFAS